ncbi:MAG: hypothetical protein ACI9OD_002321 [Limisphaerales bacterium]|jgi:hypothetical protein
MSSASPNQPHETPDGRHPLASDTLPKPVWTHDDKLALAHARSLLAQPGLAARLSAAVGGKLDQGIKLLPENWQDSIHHATRDALFKAVKLAATTLGSEEPASEHTHQLLAGASGGIGGLFGFPALAWELPLSTTLMLRAILDIARAEGHPPTELDTRLSCLEVFALGGPDGDERESGYWAVRSALAPVKSDASRYIAVNGFSTKGAPVVVKFIAAVSAKFGIIVSEQAAAKAVPVIGAAAGAAVNVLFTRHFQDMARGHFIIKRLERKYGGIEVERSYTALTTT